jgi:hypothetical protein
MFIRYKYDLTFTKNDLKLIEKSVQKFHKYDIYFIHDTEKWDCTLTKQSKENQKKNPHIGMEAEKEFSWTIYTKPIQVVFLKENWDSLPKHKGCEFKCLESYQLALINHELAHVAGFGHVDCPKIGYPADVRQQPSVGLRGCVPTTEVILYPISKQIE